MERLDVGKFTGKAKLAGTALGLGGAMLLTFYKGPDITVWRSSIDLLKAHGGPEPTNLDSKNRVIGGLAAIVSCFCYSAWMILQVIREPIVSGLQDFFFFLTAWSGVDEDKREISSRLHDLGFDVLYRGGAVDDIRLLPAEKLGGMEARGRHQALYSPLRCGFSIFHWPLIFPIVRAT